MIIGDAAGRIVDALNRVSRSAAVIEHSADTAIRGPARSEPADNPPVRRRNSTARTDAAQAEPDVLVDSDRRGRLGK
jgi:hypothetical protein